MTHSSLFSEHRFVFQFNEAGPSEISRTNADKSKSHTESTPEGLEKLEEGFEKRFQKLQDFYSALNSEWSQQEQRLTGDEQTLTKQRRSQLSSRLQQQEVYYRSLQKEGDVNKIDQWLQEQEKRMADSSKKYFHDINIGS